MRTRIPFVVLGVFAGLLVNAVVAVAWTGPTASAPNNNVAAPINVGTTAQVKNGDFGVNKFFGYDNALLSGLGVGTGRYLNFDYSSAGNLGTDAAGYGIRDNVGTLEFKNNGGAWASLQSLVAAGGSQWTGTIGNPIYYNGGNVGVGTASPGYKLDVAGTVRVGALTGDANIEAGVGATANRNAYIDFVTDTTYTDYGLRLIKYNTGPNGFSELIARGTGGLLVGTQDAAPLIFKANNVEKARIDSNGNFGVGMAASDRIQMGTVSPAATALRWYQSGTAEWWAGMTAGNSNWVLGAGAAYATPLMTVSTGGFFGIRQTSPQGPLDVATNGVNDGIVFRQNTDNSSSIQAYIDGQWANRVSYAGGCCNVLALQPDVGVVNVGGVLAPMFKLDVNGGSGWTTAGWAGSIGMNNGSALGWRADSGSQRFGIGQTNGGLYIFHSASDPGGTAAAPIYDININDAGQVGIGQNGVSYKLSVAGDIIANGAWLRSSGATGWYNESFGGGWHMSDATWIRSYGGKYVYMNPGFDTASASAVQCGGGLGAGYNFRVCGTIGATSFLYTSDIRLKENIKPIENSLWKLLQIEGVRFTWKSGDKKGQEDIGVIAQEVEKVLPEAVMNNKETGMKSVDYPRLVPLLINAIKEQQTQIDGLKKLVCADHPGAEICK